MHYAACRYVANKSAAAAAETAATTGGAAAGAGSTEQVQLADPQPVNEPVAQPDELPPAVQPEALPVAPGDSAQEGAAVGVGIVHVGSGGSYRPRLSIQSNDYSFGSYPTRREAGVVWDAANVWRTLNLTGWSCTGCVCLHAQRSALFLSGQPCTSTVDPIGWSAGRSLGRIKRTWHHPLLRLWEDAELVEGLRGVRGVKKLQEFSRVWAQRHLPAKLAQLDALGEQHGAGPTAEAAAAAAATGGKRRQQAPTLDRPQRQRRRTAKAEAAAVAAAAAEVKVLDLTMGDDDDDDDDSGVGGGDALRRPLPTAAAPAAAAAAASASLSALQLPALPPEEPLNRVEVLGRLVPVLEAAGADEPQISGGERGARGTGGGSTQLERELQFADLDPCHCRLRDAVHGADERRLVPQCVRKDCCRAAPGRPQAGGCARQARLRAVGGGEYHHNTSHTCCLPPRCTAVERRPCHCKVWLGCLLRIAWRRRRHSTAKRRVVAVVAAAAPPSVSLRFRSIR